MAVRDVGNRPILDTQGQLTNPTTSTLIADTGALPAGLYEIRVLMGASVAAQFLIARRDAGNSADVGDVPVVYTPAGQTSQIVLLYELEASERVRVMMNAAITGTAAATVQAECMT
jgi:hypothetical protein